MHCTGFCASAMSLLIVVSDFSVNIFKFLPSGLSCDMVKPKNHYSRPASFAGLHMAGFAYLQKNCVNICAL
jgi:hypothetical protein